MSNTADGIGDLFKTLIIAGCISVCVSFTTVAQTPGLLKTKSFSPLPAEVDSALQKRSGRVLNSHAGLANHWRKLHMRDSIGRDSLNTLKTLVTTDSMRFITNQAHFVSSYSDSLPALRNDFNPAGLSDSRRSFDPKPPRQLQADSVWRKMKLLDSLLSQFPNKPKSATLSTRVVPDELPAIPVSPDTVSPVSSSLEINSHLAKIPTVNPDNNQLSVTQIPANNTTGSISQVSDFKILDTTTILEVNIRQIKIVQPYTSKLDHALVQKDAMITDVRSQNIESLSKTAEVQATGILPTLPQTTRFYDPMVSKELLLNHKKEFNINHFSGHEEQVLAAIDKFSSVKTKYLNREGIIDLLNDKHEEAPDLPFLNRLRLGLAFQVQKPELLWLDFNPYLGVKLHRFIPAVGWNYRLAFSSDQGIAGEQRIYGPRVSVEYEWLKLLSPIAVVEVMNAPANRYQTDQEIKRLWTWNYMGGVKTSVAMGHKFKLTTQLLYSFVNSLRIPYSTRFNMRFTLEYRFTRQSTLKRNVESPDSAAVSTCKSLRKLKNLRQRFTR